MFLPPPTPERPVPVNIRMTGMVTVFKMIMLDVYNMSWFKTDKEVEAWVEGGGESNTKKVGIGLWLNFY